MPAFGIMSVNDICITAGGKITVKSDNNFSKIRKQTLRVIITAALMTAMVFFAAGCGGENYPEIKIDAAKMANAIVENVDFESRMQQISREGISNFIDLPETDSAYMFMGSGEKADSFGVFVFNTKNDAKSGEKAVKDYLKDLGDSFSKYIPE